MEKFRRDYAREVRENLLRLEKTQKRDMQVLENSKNLKSSEALTQKIAEIQKAVIVREKEIEELRNKETDILAGNRDFEIKTEDKPKPKPTKRIPLKIETPLLEKVPKGIVDVSLARVEPVLRKRDEEIHSRTHESSSRLPEDRTDKLEKDYVSSYRYYCKVAQSFPSYMSEKLKFMPNNRGYIWRGCWFFGERDSEYGQPTVMHEKRGGQLLIHEYDKYEHRTYEKTDKGKKLISTVPKKPIS